MINLDITFFIQIVNFLLLMLALNFLLYRPLRKILADRAAEIAGGHAKAVEVDKDVQEKMALIENIQREDLNAVEEAEAYQALLDKFSLSQEELARRVGKERSTVANSLRLLKLPGEIKRDIVEERLTMGHARALLALDNPEQLKRGREEIIGKHLTVREAESLVKRLKSNRVRPPRKQLDPQMTDLVEQLKRHFKAKVALRQGSRGGKLEISYANLDDLTRIIDIITS